ncbi:MAG TPA: histidine kinase dimerization/phospho-acceptor domain-containing protein [Polyangia bacterium]
MRIALLLDDDDARCRLTEALGEHEVVVATALAPGDQGVDLCVVAPALLPRLRKALRARRAGPVAGPVLGAVGPGDEAAAAAALGDTLDDLVRLDASRAEVQARVAVLLRLRAATAALATASGASPAAAQTAELRVVKDQRDDLLRAVSHDLRTPLAIIHLQSQLLREVLEKAGQRDKTVTRSLDAILTAGRRMNSMIEDLVDLSRHQRGMLKLEMRSVDLAAFLGDLFDRAEPFIRTPRGVIEIPAGTPRVLVDENRLERIFLNLITNALRHAPADHRPHARAAAGDADLFVAVGDHAAAGAAEPLEAVRARLTDEALLARQVEGLGAGLLITALLVEVHGGRIWAERTGPRNAPAFFFTLPLAPAA